ncbi:MAG: FAD binding domain-containing protein, partial [Terriglobia bacterium]
MSNFDYAAPTSLAQATALLEGAHGTARVLAGGTDLIVQLREHLRDADLVVNIKKIPELMELSYSSQLGLRLGASVPCHRIYEHAEIPVAYPALADAARIVGGWQIQSRASVGGNLCNSSPAADTIPAL